MAHALDRLDRSRRCRRRAPDSEPCTPSRGLRPSPDDVPRAFANTTTGPHGPPDAYIQHAAARTETIKIGPLPAAFVYGARTPPSSPRPAQAPPLGSVNGTKRTLGACGVCVSSLNVYELR